MPRIRSSAGARADARFAAISLVSSTDAGEYLVTEHVGRRQVLKAERRPRVRRQRRSLDPLAGPTPDYSFSPQ
jgi:hypothetical protein